MSAEPEGGIIARGRRTSVVGVTPTSDAGVTPTSDAGVTPTSAAGVTGTGVEPAPERG
jgi:hypothetical protein